MFSWLLFNYGFSESKFHLFFLQGLQSIDLQNDIPSEMERQ